MTLTYIIIVFILAIFFIYTYFSLFIIWDKIKKAGAELKNKKLEEAGRESLKLLKISVLLIFIVTFIQGLSIIELPKSTACNCADLIMKNTSSNAAEIKKCFLLIEEDENFERKVTECLNKKN